ncbi:hypothetical protein COLO4_35221 [Corchorus olitorius]|uniref:Uncharacterized protein n=1 Tax=Corchorus olitorius TaxID=93759 RepID=A0A1R3GHS4_9ROSI|nr:hypothetical protein COLO4_35221 [Corchorus olitorius]
MPGAGPSNSGKSPPRPPPLPPPHNVAAHEITQLVRRVQHRLSRESTFSALAENLINREYGLLARTDAVLRDRQIQYEEGVQVEGLMQQFEGEMQELRLRIRALVDEKSDICIRLDKAESTTHCLSEKVVELEKCNLLLDGKNKDLVSEREYMLAQLSEMRYRNDELTKEKEELESVLQKPLLETYHRKPTFNFPWKVCRHGRQILYEEADADTGSSNPAPSKKQSTSPGCVFPVRSIVPVGSSSSSSSSDDDLDAGCDLHLFTGFLASLGGNHGSSPH